MALRHCAMHTGFAHDCPDCHAMNPTRKTCNCGAQQDLLHGWTHAPDCPAFKGLQTANDTNRDPYNYHGKHMMPDQFLFKVKLSEPRCIIEMGSLNVQITRRFNMFHRWMMRTLLGWKVTNL